jgi:hypothetical protein
MVAVHDVRLAEIPYQALPRSFETAIVSKCLFLQYVLEKNVAYSANRKLVFWNCGLRTFLMLAVAQCCSSCNLGHDGMNISFMVDKVATMCTGVGPTSFKSNMMFQ